MRYSRWKACARPPWRARFRLLHAGWRQFFDPDGYRIVLFDQRGCGRSTPHASDLNVDLSANTTVHLLADIESLRRHLGIERWLVLGGSWGSTLALAYAEQHPNHVSEMVLFSVTTTTAWEIDWVTRGVGIFFPEAWARFRDGVPEAERTGSLVDAYHRLLMNPDPAIHEKAARDWCDWEIAFAALHPNDKPHPRYERSEFRLGFARLVTHYWCHNAWLQDGVLLREANRLSGIPGVLIHGRLDLGCPLITPWRLKQNWPGTEHVIVSAAGHGAGDPGVSETIVAATDRFGAAK